MSKFRTMSAGKKRAKGLHKVLAMAEMVQENYPCEFCGVGYGKLGPDEPESLMKTCPICKKLTCPDHRAPILFRMNRRGYPMKGKQCVTCFITEITMILEGHYVTVERLVNRGKGEEIIYTYLPQKGFA